MVAAHGLSYCKQHWDETDGQQKSRKGFSNDLPGEYDVNW